MESPLMDNNQHSSWNASDIPGHIVDVFSDLNNATFPLLRLATASMMVLPKRLVLPVLRTVEPVHYS